MKRKLSIAALLIIVTILTYSGLSRLGFVNYDDPYYILQNQNIQHGLSLQSLRWAFTTGHAGNWHPLTWVSHMIDVSLFGLNPSGHHLTNLLFHIANTLLVFLLSCP